MNFIFLEGANPGAGLNNMILLGLMFLVIYFFLMRPQQRRQKQQNAFVDELSKGDKVVTTSGIHGKIMEINEDDGVVVLQIDKNKGVNIRIQKSAISKELSEAFYGGEE